MKPKIFAIVCLTIVVIFINCKTTPVTIFNNTGTNILDARKNNGKYTFDESFNLKNGETIFWDYNNNSLPIGLIFIEFTSPVFGKTNTTHFSFVENKKNFITIHSDNTATIVVQ